MPEDANANQTVFLASFALYTLGIVAVGLYSARYARRSDEDRSALLHEVRQHIEKTLAGWRSA